MRVSVQSYYTMVPAIQRTSCLSVKDSDYSGSEEQSTNTKEDPTIDWQYHNGSLPTDGGIVPSLGLTTSRIVAERCSIECVIKHEANTSSANSGTNSPTHTTITRWS